MIRRHRTPPERGLLRTALDAPARAFVGQIRIVC